MSWCQTVEVEEERSGSTYERTGNGINERGGARGACPKTPQAACHQAALRLMPPTWAGTLCSEAALPPQQPPALVMSTSRALASASERKRCTKAAPASLPPPPALLLPPPAVLFGTGNGRRDGTQRLVLRCRM